jgi:hypothetical protein
MGDKKGLPSLPSLPDKVDKYDKLNYVLMPFDPINVKNKALLEIEGKKVGESFESTDSFIVSAMTLQEFHHGYLMATSLGKEYRTFAVQLSRDYQKQYKCDTVGKKSLAELSAINYCRILEAQNKLDAYMSKEAYGDLTVKIMAVLSKEIDRAQRHYLTSMQALELGLQQPLTVSIRTNTANIAGQQAIQQVGEQTNVKG